MLDMIIDPSSIETGAEPPWIVEPDPWIEDLLEDSEKWGWLFSSESLPSDVTLEVIIRNLIESTGVGEPWYFSLFWQLQFLSFNCSVAVQKAILASLDIDVTEGELTETAIRHGWLTEAGASFADCGKLLEYYGIETHTVLQGNVALLIQELEAGNRIIVPIDAGELWADTFLEEIWEWFEDLFGAADHVVWITGIDMTDPENPTVIVNDTGDPEGAGRVYPLSLFQDAWADADFSYIATGTLPDAS